MKKHRWSKEDDIVAFYLYKFGTKNISISINDIANKLGISTASIKMRIANYKALDKGKGLDHYAILSKKVYEDYNSYSETDLRRIIESILYEIKKDEK